MKNFKIGDLLARIPIVQGGMGVGVSLSGLASAVANEGGVGVISSAGLGLLYKKRGLDFCAASIEGLRSEVREARQKSKGVIGVNIMVAMTNFSDMVKTSIEEKIDVIFSGAGLPLNLPSYLTKDSETKLVPIVSSIRALKLICQKWLSSYNYLPDAIVLEGPKAGGHLGFKKNQLADEAFSLEAMLPAAAIELARIEKESGKKIPLIAAGGIFTGEDVYKAIELGATAVQMGTRFVTTVECDASESFKQLYIDATEEDVVIIDSPVGMPGRALRSPFLEQVALGNSSPKSCPFHCIHTCKVEKSPYCIMLALYNAYKGNFTRGYAFAGTSVAKAKAIVTVKEMLTNLKSEWEEFSFSKRELAMG